MRIMPLTLATVLSLGAPALAQDPPRLGFPVDCTLGETCFLQQFMDRDPGPGARAFDCGPQSYDGHTGTDIRLVDFAAMAAGVAVLSAAPGTVRAVRDGVLDGGTPAMPEGQGCGNGVVLAHADGWETQYCHLMEGSLIVAAGDRVETGTPLGLIGYSGTTEFPHLEFLLRRNGEWVDPFDPSDLNQCGAGAAALWDPPLSNPGGGILSIGFANGLPAFDAIQNGEVRSGRLNVFGDALVLWGYVHGARAGDILRLVITDAEGAAVFTQDAALDRTQAQLFRAGGRRTPDAGWPPGVYRGAVTLMRGDATVDQATTTVILTRD